MKEQAGQTEEKKNDMESNNVSEDKELSDNQIPDNGSGIEEKISESREEPVKKEEIGEEEQKKTEELENSVKEMNDKYLRLYAEFDNYRKRVTKEKEELQKYGAESLVSELLPVIDSLELALSHVSDDVKDSLVQGVEMTLKELKKTLENAGLSEVEAKEKPFDPRFHHAMTEVEKSEFDDKTVLEVFRKGYTYKERLLRPAMVSVSKKKESDTEEKTKKIDIKVE